MAVNYINLADIDRSVQQSRIGDAQLENIKLARQDREREMQRQAGADQQQMRLRDIYSQGGGDLNKTRQELYNQGFYEQGAAVDKQLGEQSKVKSEAEKAQLENAGKRIGLIGNGMKFILDNPTKENAIMTFNQLRSVGVLTPEQYDEYTAQLPDDPAMIKRGAEVLFRGALDAKDQLSKYETRDAGGTVQTQQIDPVTGQIKTVGTINKTQTPDNIASNARMASEGAANRGVQIRGQNLTNQRAQEKNAIDASGGGYSTKPLPATALKMQNEALDKLSIASNNTKKLLDVKKQIESGSLKLGLLSNIEGNIRNRAGVSNESSRNLSSFKSTLEKLRNDSLRLNTGVQTDGDAQRAWNELFENINDEELVKQRLGEIAEINKRGADLQKLQVDNIRGNYNAAPVDFGKYEVKGSGASGSFDAPTTSGWSIKRK
jgi:hypothetical protein